MSYPDYAYEAERVHGGFRVVLACWDLDRNGDKDYHSRPIDNIVYEHESEAKKAAQLAEAISQLTDLQDATMGLLNGKTLKPEFYARLATQRINSARALIAKHKPDAELAPEAPIDAEILVINIIADIREKSGVGAKPMITELAVAIGDKIATLEQQITGLAKKLKDNAK